jgi:NADH-quinone oxidoreductase subunit E
MPNEAVDRILERHLYDESQLIGMLQDIQAVERYLPRESLEYLSVRLHIPASKVYHVATFFKAFSLQPRGKYEITVCMGTACHVRGGQRILEKLERDLNIREGETSKNRLFTLEAVNCLGACAMGPIVVVNGDYHGEMTSVKVSRLLKRIFEMEKR